MFIRNAWYFAGFAGDIGGALAERRFLGESVVMFRTPAGRAVAFSNRCPHRFAPLSMGRLVGDRLQCAYHGIEFDFSGRCVHIPGQPKIQKGACVRAYPVEERWGCVWIWMGEPARASVDALIPEFGVLADPRWAPVHGVKEVAAGYELVIDNLMDLTHIAYLHPNTLGNQGGAQAAEAEAHTTVKGERVRVERVIRDCEPAPLYRSVRDIAGRIDRYQYSEFVPPCYVLIELKVMPAGTQDLASGLEWRVFHIVTPTDERHTSYRWVVTRHFAQDDAQVSQALWDGTNATLDEDRAMIEAQARMLEGTSLDARTLPTRHDGTPARVRRIIRELARREEAPLVAETGP
ncbi:MAG: aromatic ring-hydroxylating dioxygenase subunit alpha [Burkholderiales bacterium]|nr:aromatic ring-hydroxylating dioxygenase subunit alpha [Burkholderiales bacterium]